MGYDNLGRSQPERKIDRRKKVDVGAEEKEMDADGKSQLFRFSHGALQWVAYITFAPCVNKGGSSPEHPSLSCPSPTPNNSLRCVQTENPVLVLLRFGDLFSEVSKWLLSLLLKTADY